MTSANRHSATPVRHVRGVPAPTAIPSDTSPEIAASIRRTKLEQEQQAALDAVCAELGIDIKAHRRTKRKNDGRYTAQMQRRSRLGEGDTFTRQQIIDRDHRTCYVCNRTGLSDSEIHIDHVLPLARGGTHTLDNVRVACPPCNLGKGTKTLSEYRATLRMRRV